MNVPEFLEPYQRTLPWCVRLEEAQQHTPEERVDMWSHRFGMLLHDMLTDTPSDVFTTDFEMTSYRQWNQQISTGQLELYATPARKLAARNRSNFHALNRGMLKLWTGVQGWGSDHDRQYWLRYSEDVLAFEGFQYYLSRRKRIMDGGGTEILFTPAAQERTQSANGVMEEFDVAISAIDWLLRDPKAGKGTTIVPAPLQFGDGAGAERKADFVIVDADADKAVALRSAQHTKHTVIDADRVVLIDGKYDLSNEIAVRTRKLHSDEEVRFWPGIIAAKKLANIVLKGKRRSPLVRELERQPNDTRAWAIRGLHQHKHVAQLLTEHLSHDADAIRGRIGPKITEKL